MGSEAHLSEDKAKKAMIDAARLADELRAEQGRMRAERDAGSPPRPSEEENARNKEALILHLKSENEAQVRAAQVPAGGARRGGFKRRGPARRARG